MLKAGWQPMYENGLLNTLAADDCLHPGGIENTRRLLNLLDLPAGAKILDLACGNCSSLGKFFNGNDQLAFGLDLSLRLLHQGQQAAPHLGLACGSGLSLPFADHSLDAALAECSLTAIGKIRQVLHEVSRILKKGGRLAVSDLYVREPAGLPALRGLPLNSGVQSAYSLDELANLLRTEGFEIIQWEDHSDTIKGLTSQMIGSCCPASEFWQQAEPAADPMEILIACSKAKIGYFLLTAQKV